MQQEISKNFGPMGNQRKEADYLVQLLESTTPVTGHFGEYAPKDSIRGEYDEVTFKQLVKLVALHNYYKKHLFNDRLCQVYLTLNRTDRYKGYYQHSAWIDQDGIIIPEISVNPELFGEKKIDMASTLVYGQCQLLQYLYGSPGRAGYHNRQFARIMETIGLMCSDTGQPGGKQTGERMSFYVIPGGRFEQAFNAMPHELALPLRSFPRQQKRSRKSPGSGKIKYQCVHCGIAAWGKPNLGLRCEACDTKLVY